MLPLRVIVIVLLFANLLALAIWKGWLGGGPSYGEPERLSNQLNPDRIHLVPELRAVAARPTVVTPRPAEAPPTDEKSAAPAPQAEGAAPQACVVFSGLSVDQLRELTARVTRAGTGFKLTETRGEAASSWWVHVPSQGSKEGAEKKAAELRRHGVEELFILQDPGPQQFAISLGLFKNEQAATRQLAALQEKGVRSAQIASRGSVIRLEVKGPGDGLATLASDLSERLRGVSRLECSP